MTVTMQSLAEAARVLRDAGKPRTLIYFVQEGDDGPVKIGASKDPRVRLGRLQIGNPRRLRVRAIYPALALEEHQLHDEFAHAHLGGEWFAPTPELLRTADALDDPVARKDAMRSWTPEEENAWDIEVARTALL